MANSYVHELIASTARQLVGRGNAGADVEEEIKRDIGKLPTFPAAAK